MRRFPVVWLLVVDLPRFSRQGNTDRFRIR